jgi:hypothetical protein
MIEQQALSIEQEQIFLDDIHTCESCFGFQKEVDYNFYTGEILMTCTSCGEKSAYEDTRI